MIGSPNRWSSRPAGSVLSFDDTAGATGPNASAGISRLMASLSLSRSKSSTEHSDDTKSGGEQRETTPQSRQVVSPVSQMSEISEEGPAATTEVEHPLANIIPPMLVIDDIDDYVDTVNSDDRKRAQESDVFPSKRVGASSSFLAALNESRNATQSSFLAGML